MHHVAGHEKDAPTERHRVNGVSSETDVDKDAAGRNNVAFLRPDKSGKYVVTLTVTVGRVNGVGVWDPDTQYDVGAKVVESRRRWHLAPAGVAECDGGQNAGPQECEEAVAVLAAEVGEAPGRSTRRRAWWVGQEQGGGSRRQGRGVRGREQRADGQEALIVGPTHSQYTP